MKQARIAVGAMTVIAALVCAGAAASASASSPGVAKLGVVAPTGKRAMVTGSLAKCRKGSNRTVKVRLGQRGKVARGSWSAGCDGGRQHWRVFVSTRGAGLGTGKARVRVAVQTSSRGESRTRLIHKRIRLVRKSAGQTGDTVISADLTFTLPAAWVVRIEGGGAGGQRSNCTKDESQSIFTSNGTPYTIPFAFTARDGGSCSWQPSYNNAYVQITRPNGTKLDGYFWLGQLSAGLAYFADCRTGIPPFDVRNYRWNGLFCASSDRHSLGIILQPG